MKIIRSRVTPFVMAVVLLLQISPAVAGGQLDAQLAMAQGARVPGMPVPGTDSARNKRHGPVDVTFTKWRTAVIPPLPAPTVRSLFAGFVGGDLGAGDFVAEVLDRKASTPGTITVPIAALHAIYEVQAGDHSFIALIQGGTNGVTGVGLLEGVILAGWRTGAHVQVAFQTISSCTDRDAVAHGPCFEGTIHVERAPEK
jgi:hypothetical protein